MDNDKIVHRIPPSAAGDYPNVFVASDRYRHAKNALKLYEEKQDAKFQIVALYPYTYKIHVIIPSIDKRLGDWVHTSFIAKPTTSETSTNDDHVEEDPKLFFAELVQFNNESFSLSHCEILDPNDPEITYSCGICDPTKKIPHSSKYKLGHWSYQNGKIPDSVYESKWFLEETPGSSKGRRLDLNKLFDGDVPTHYARSMMVSADFAELALELDKDKKGQDADQFELVEALGFYRRVFHSPRKEDWVHVGFTAKPKTDCSNESDGVSPKQFFAELFAPVKQKKYSLVQCSILKLDDPGITYECGICDPNRIKMFAHPSDYLATEILIPGFKTFDQMVFNKPVIRRVCVPGPKRIIIPKGLAEALTAQVCDPKRIRIAHASESEYTAAKSDPKRLSPPQVALTDQVCDPSQKEDRTSS